MGWMGKDVYDELVEGIKENFSELNPEKMEGNFPFDENFSRKSQSLFFY
jgi:hypothetical protein